MTEQVEQQIYIRFGIKLEHSSMETIHVIQKVTAMGKWWLLAASSRHVSCLMQRFFGETWNHPGDSAPLQPRFGTLWLLAFPQTEIIFEREEISDPRWDSGKYDEAANGDWENCVRFQGASFEGDWGVIVLCTVFLVSYIFFSKCPCFSYYVLDTFWTGLLCLHMKKSRWIYTHQSNGTNFL